MGSSARPFREEQPSRRKEISRLFESKRKTIVFLGGGLFLLNGTSARLNEEKGEKMKLQLMFLVMDVLMLLACGYFWLKVAFVRALRWR
jgi:uncharacterized membrane protein